MVQPLDGAVCHRVAVESRNAGHNPSTTSRRRFLAALAGALVAAPNARVRASNTAGVTPDVGATDGSSDVVPRVSTGERIASFALQYLGYRYRAGGNTPSGFDCAGFARFVIRNTLGIDIGHGVAGQVAYGRRVNWGEWQPGDLVYFQNTYRAGISHTGIYLSEGRFIHAENPGTGVVISSLYSTYYGNRYWGARRHG